MYVLIVLLSAFLFLLPQPAKADHEQIYVTPHFTCLGNMCPTLPPVKEKTSDSVPVPTAAQTQTNFQQNTGQTGTTQSGRGQTRTTANSPTVTQPPCDVKGTSIAHDNRSRGNGKKKGHKKKKQGQIGKSMDQFSKSFNELITMLFKMLGIEMPPGILLPTPSGTPAYPSGFPLPSGFQLNSVPCPTGASGQTNTSAIPTEVYLGNGMITDPKFFPIAVWNQANMANANVYRGIGVNMFIGLSNQPNEAQLTTLKTNSILAVPVQTNVGLTSPNKTLIAAWLLQDQPEVGTTNTFTEGPCLPVSQVLAQYTQTKSVDVSKKPVYLHLSRGVADPSWSGPQGCSGQNDYSAYVAAGDILSFESYPINNNLPITAVATGVDNLRRWSQFQKPVYAAIETTKIANGTAPTAAQIKAEVWLALTHGATGIMYATHQEQPAVIEAALLREGAMTTAIKDINTQIKKVAEIINTQSVIKGVSVSSPQRIDVMTKVVNGETYVFAVSPNAGPVTAGFSIPGISNAIVSVIDENRTITMTNGIFQDTFTNYAVHIYKVSGETLGNAPSVIPNYTPQPTIVPSTVPTSAPTTNASPTPPCEVLGTSIAHYNKKNKGNAYGRYKHKKKKTGQIGKNSEALFKFFMQLLTLLLQLLSLQPKPAPYPVPTGAPTATPTDEPVPTDYEPTEAPCPLTPSPSYTP